ncbi:acyl-CoA dehydrogenase family protein [Endothiovibrio diazotrophicus]
MTLTTGLEAVSPVMALEGVISGLEHEDQPFGTAQVTELDRQEAFPAAAYAVLQEFGLSRHYVPTGFGGKLASYPDLPALWRTVARRDLTAAIGHGKTFLGGICTWLAGRPEQAAALGAEIAAGTVVSWGLTERHHGSDLLAGELSAERCDGGWRINGEKWLINNATRGQMICVLARTDAGGGPRGFSLFLIDKRTLPEYSYRFLPKERTHGIRGADISGIAFEHALIPAEALIGEVGQGIEISLKALQITRTACVGLSLGAADRALALVTDFAKGHRLYERHLIDLPPARFTLGEAMAGLLLAEAVTTVASRAIHALSAEMSVISAITKALVPSLVDQMIAQLGELMGARSFLTEVYAHGLFPKLERDHRLIAIFDGNTVVNRNALINQFPNLARAYGKGYGDEAGLAAATDLDLALADFDPTALQLLSAKGCSPVQALPQAVRRCRVLADGGRLALGAMRKIDALLTATEQTIAAMAAYRPAPRDVPAAAFQDAARYEWCFAGAVCVHLWLANAEAGCERNAALWSHARWLDACLTFALDRLRALPGGEGLDYPAYEALVDVLASGDPLSPVSLWSDSGPRSGK